MKKASSFPLRMPQSLRAAVEELAKEDGSSINQFLVMAAAEKVAALKTAQAFLEQRGSKADMEAARAFLNRPGTKPPVEGDELPEGWSK